MTNARTLARLAWPGVALAITGDLAVISGSILHHDPMLIVGLAMIGVAVPMTIAGTFRRIRTVQSVARELMDGLEDGSIVLRDEGDDRR